MARLGQPILSFPSKDEYVFMCPRPGCGSRTKGKPKLAVNISADVFNCWVCGFAGRSLSGVMVPGSVEQREYSEGGPAARPPARQEGRCLAVPSECTPFALSGDAMEWPYVAYLRRRGIAERTVGLRRLLYADRGPCAGRIVVPSFDSRGDVNLYVARTVWDRKPTYMMPEASKDIVFDECLVDWRRPVRLVEGVFDALVMGEQAVPLLGKFLQPSLALRLLKGVPMVHICLDADAMAEAWELAEQLLSYDVPCAVVRCPAKDPADAGREAMEGAISGSRTIGDPIGLVMARGLG